MVSLRKISQRRTDDQQVTKASDPMAHFDFEKAARVAKEIVRDNQEWLKEMARK